MQIGSWSEIYAEIKVYLDTSVISHLLQEDVTKAAKKIIEIEILTQKGFDDCQYIGVAVINECDCIISWNFKHIVNVKTIRGVRAITNLEGYKMIEIWNPSVLLESEG